MRQDNQKLKITGSDLNHSWRAKPRQPHGSSALPNYQNNGMPGPKMEPPKQPSLPFQSQTPQWASQMVGGMKANKPNQREGMLPAPDIYRTPRPGEKTPVAVKAIDLTPAGWEQRRASGGNMEEYPTPTGYRVGTDGRLMKSDSPDESIYYEALGANPQKGPVGYDPYPVGVAAGGFWDSVSNAYNNMTNAPSSIRKAVDPQGAKNQREAMELAASNKQMQLNEEEMYDEFSRLWNSGKTKETWPQYQARMNAIQAAASPAVATPAAATTATPTPVAPRTPEEDAASAAAMAEATAAAAGAYGPPASSPGSATFQSSKGYREPQKPTPSADAEWDKTADPSNVRLPAVPNWAIEKYADAVGGGPDAMNAAWKSELAKLQSKIPPEEFNNYLNKIEGGLVLSPGEALKEWNRRQAASEVGVARGNLSGPPMERFERQNEMTELQQSVPKSMFDRYRANVDTGREKMSPTEALADYNKNIEELRSKASPEYFARHMEDLESGIGRSPRDANKYYTEEDDQQISGMRANARSEAEKRVGTPSDIKNREARLSQAESYVEGLGAPNREAGTLSRITPSSTGFGGDRETQDATAAFYKDLESREVAARDDRRQGLRAKTDDFYADQRKYQGEMEKTHGIGDMKKTQNELNKLSGQLTVFNRSQGSNGQKMDLGEFVQAKINSKELEYNSDLTKWLEGERGYRFNPPGTRTEGRDLDAIYGTGQQAVSQYRTAVQGRRQEGRPEGMNDKQWNARQQRTSDANAQSRFRNTKSGLEASGYTPQQAAALAYSQADAQNNPGKTQSVDQMAQGFIQGGMAPEPAYRLAQEQYKLNANAAAQGSEAFYRAQTAANQLEHQKGRDKVTDQQAEKAISLTQRQLIAQHEADEMERAMQANGGIMPKPGDPAYDLAQQRINAYRKSFDLPEIDGSATSSPEANKRRAVSSIREKVGESIADEDSIAAVGRATSGIEGLDAKSKAEVVGEVMGISDITSPIKARDTVKKIFAKISTAAKAAGEEGSTIFGRGGEDLRRELESQKAHYMDTLKIIMPFVSPEERGKIMAELNAEMFDGTNDSMSIVENILLLPFAPIQWFDETVKSDAIRRNKSPYENTPIEDAGQNPYGPNPNVILDPRTTNQKNRK